MPLRRGEPCLCLWGWLSLPGLQRAHLSWHLLFLSLRKMSPSHGPSVLLSGHTDLPGPASAGLLMATGPVHMWCPLPPGFHGMRCSEALSSAGA